MANPTYTIHAYNNNDLLSGLFNAIASMFGTGSFQAMIAMVLTIGFISSLVAMAFARDRLQGVKWLFGVIMVNAILLVPKATVQIVDVTGSQPPKVIANVPWGLAAQASIVSSIGRQLTVMFETSFQTVTSNPLSAAMSYSANGMMFGSKLISSSREMNFANPLFRSNMINFIANCTVYDLTQNRIPASAFLTTNADVWPAMANTNLARYSMYNDGTSTESFACNEVYAKLNDNMVAQTNSMISKLGVAMFPRARNASGGVSAAEANALLQIALPEAYTRAKLGDATRDAAILLRQNAIINAATDAMTLTAQAANDPSAMIAGAAKAQAIAALNAQYVTKMQMAQETLPLLRNSVEAILYAAFPMIVLLAMIFGGVGAYELLKKYSLGLIWVSLWAPLYAVVNYLAMFNAERNLAAAGFDAGAVVGLTISTANSIYSTALNQAANVGDLMMAVPLIAGAIVFGLDKLVNVAAGSMTSVGSAVGASSSTASTGNLSQGNVNFDKLDYSSSKTSQDMSAFTNAVGTTTRDTATGDVRYQTMMGTNALKLTDMQSIGTTASESSKASLSISESKSKEAANASIAALTEGTAISRSASSGTASGTGTQFKDGSSAATRMSALREVTESVANELGISNSAAAGIVFAASGGVGTGDAMPFAQATLKATGTTQSETKLSDAMKRASAAMEKAGITNTNDVVQQYAQTDEFKRTGGTNNESGKRIEASLNQSTQLRESAKLDRVKSEQHERVAQNAQTFARAGEYNWSNEFNAFLIEKIGAEPGKLSQQETTKYAQQFLESGDVRQGPGGSAYIIPDNGAGAPNKTPLSPNSFADPNRADAAFNAPVVLNGKPVDDASLRAQHQANSNKVKANSTVNQTGLPTAASVAAKGEVVQAKAAAAEERTGVIVASSDAALQRQSVQAGRDAPSQILAPFDVTAPVITKFIGVPPVTDAAQRQQESDRARGVVNPEKPRDVPSPGSPGHTPG